MRLLIDTHIFLWWLADDPALAAEQRKAVQDKRNSCFISAATIWEITIKTSIGKLEIDPSYLELAKAQGFLELPVRWDHAKAVESLPDYHKDPFDRILIAQALCEDMTMVSSDSIIRQYGVPLI